MRKKNKQKLHRVRMLTPIFAIIIAVASFFVLKPLMSGFVIVSEEINYVDIIDEEFNKNQNYTWIPEHGGELLRLAISGSIIGNGSAKLYIECNNRFYLILDSEEVMNKKTAFITGLVVGANESNIEENDSNNEEINNSLIEKNLVNDSLLEINQTINHTLIENYSEKITYSIEENLVDDSLITNYSFENQTLPPSSPNVTEKVEAGEPEVVLPEKVIGINLAYNSGTDYDKDDNGIETKDGIIDLTVEETIFSWDVDYNKLCTKWEVYSIEKKESTIVCYGNQECCNFIELQPSSENWNDDLYLYSGRYGATANNIIGAQVIYVDYKLDIDEPTVEIYYSEFDELDAIFIEQISFMDVCSETCILYGFNETSYNLIVEVEDGTVLHINDISYRVKIDKILDLIAPNPVTNVQVSTHKGGLLVTWENPSDLDFADVRILRKKGSYPNVNYSKAILDDSVDDVSYLVDSGQESIIDNSVEYESVYFYRVYAYDINLNYAPGQGAFIRYLDMSINHAPDFIENIGEIRIFKNTKKILDLGAYFKDADGDNLSFKGFKVDNITILIEDNITTIIPDKDFIGIRYTYFTANDSELTTVSNLVILNFTDYHLDYRENIIQLDAEINKPVEWVKYIYVTTREQELRSYNVEFSILENSELIEVFDIIKNKSVDRSDLFFKLNETMISLQDSDEMLSYDFVFTDTVSVDEDKLYAIRYQTKAPSIEEEVITNYKKRMIISSDVSYRNILAYTDLSEESIAEAVKLYHITDRKELIENVTRIDANNNGLIDRIEWLVPHLSKQVYELEVNSLELTNIETENNSWIIEISTTGTADLIIQGIDTKFTELLNDNESTNDDIRFISLQCGDKILFDTIHIDDPNLQFVLENKSMIAASLTKNKTVRIDSILYNNYECDSITQIILRPLVEKRHSLMIRFDGIDKPIGYTMSVKIPVTELYYSTSCPPCNYNGTPGIPNFCPRTNAWHGSVEEISPTYISYAELEFDISSLENDLIYAEICGYVYTIHDIRSPAINYIERVATIEPTAASPVILTATIPHSNISNIDSWQCIQITDLLKTAKSERKSKFIVRWLGEDEKEQKANIACFRGISTSLDKCGGYNPSGANDCRPYLNIIYER